MQKIDKIGLREEAEQLGLVGWGSVGGHEDWHDCRI